MAIGLKLLTFLLNAVSTPKTVQAVQSTYLLKDPTLDTLETGLYGVGDVVQEAFRPYTLLPTFDLEVQCSKNAFIVPKPLREMLIRHLPLLKSQMRVNGWSYSN